MAGRCSESAGRSDGIALGALSLCFAHRIIRKPLRTFRSDALARFPARWNHLADDDSRQINMLEQIIDHVHFRSFRSEVIKRDRNLKLARDRTEKPVSTFPDHAPRQSL